MNFERYMSNGNLENVLAKYNKIVEKRIEEMKA